MNISKLLLLSYSVMFLLVVLFFGAYIYIISFILHTSEPIYQDAVLMPSYEEIEEGIPTYTI